MSKNTNRAKLNKAKNNHQYRILWLMYMYPPYSDYDWSWVNKKFPNHKGRSYTTWKHTRKTQWKE